MDDSTNLPADALRSLVDLVSEPACLVAADEWRILYSNPAFVARSLIGEDESGAGGFFAAFPELNSTAIRMQLAEVVQGKRNSARFESGVSPHLAGAIAAIRARRINSNHGVVLAIVLEERSMAEREEVSSYTVDPLTGLFDRAYILEKLRNLVGSDREGDGSCVVLFIDVDGFKQVNDSFGHLVGDRVLSEVARRLAGSVRTRDHIARFGGDEFLVVLERVNDPRVIEPVVRRIQVAFDRPIVLPQGEVTLSVSVGAAQANETGGSAEMLIDAADRAMYAAKRANV
jgi:diguanylate cyclase (GGDEF)-like protein